VTTFLIILYAAGILPAYFRCRAHSGARPGYDPTAIVVGCVLVSLLWPLVGILRVVDRVFDLIFPAPKG